MELREFEAYMSKRDKGIRGRIMRFYYDTLNTIENTQLAIKHGFQRMFRGYDDNAYWSLDCYLTDIALPVLRFYRKDGAGHPADMNEEQWNDILDKMIYSFEYVAGIDRDYNLIRDDMPRVQEGFELFGRHFRELWD